MRGPTGGGGAPPFMPMVTPASAPGTPAASPVGLGGFPARGGFARNPMLMGGLMGLADAFSGRAPGAGMARGYSMAQQAMDNDWQRRIQSLQMRKLQADMARQQQTEERLANLAGNAEFQETLGPLAGVWSGLPSSVQANLAAEVFKRELVDEGTVVEGADGYKYWSSGPKAGERVLPGVQAKPPTEKWSTIPDSGGVRYSTTSGDIHPDDLERHEANLAAGNVEALSFENKLRFRKEFDAKPVIKNARSIRVNLDRIKSLVEADTGFADHSLIFNYMKILDPDSVVREGEFYYASQVGSMEDRVANLMNKMVAGESLTPTQRAELLHTVQTLAKPSLDAAQDTQSRYSDYARREGVDPYEIVGKADQFVIPEPGPSPRQRARQSAQRAGTVPAPTGPVYDAPTARALARFGIDPEEPDALVRLRVAMEAEEEEMRRMSGPGPGGPLAPGMGGPGGVWAGP